MLFTTFAKLNANHLLMANTFKLHKYQAFSLMRCIIRAKFDLFENLKIYKFLTMKRRFF